MPLAEATRTDPPDATLIVDDNISYSHKITLVLKADLYNTKMRLSAICASFETLNEISYSVPPLRPAAAPSRSRSACSLINPAASTWS